jgi:hypothetical protein
MRNGEDIEPSILDHSTRGGCKAVHAAMAFGTPAPYIGG